MAYFSASRPGDSDYFSTQPLTNQVLSYISNQIDFNQPISALDPFQQRARELYYEAHNAAELRRTRELLSRYVSEDDPRIIRPIRTIQQAQNANPRMIRYLMANPIIQKQARSEMCYGYADRYIDLYPEDSRETHPVYQEVMNGLYQFNDEDDSHLIQQFYMDENEAVVPLSLSEVVDIRDSWANVIALLDDGEEDPTSPFGDSL